eukprot:TRINITY_DN29979_c0_g3_i1.p2 TRINITY_DN29979_c0_g3~~TRINITY_DN29979_c0_g3_i1.p2  ORF type:complete len:291 (-),score=101.63 TRINITY_DN29979_c0_g3_i1:150-1022(-)
MAELDVNMLGLKRPAKAEEVKQENKKSKQAELAGQSSASSDGVAAIAAAAASTGGRAAPKPSAARQQRGGRRGHTAEDEELLQLVAKLSLGNARQVATLQAILVKTMLFNNDTGTKGEDFFETIRLVTMAYSQQVEKMEQAAKAAFAAPHTFVWLEAVNYVRKELTETKEEWALQAAEHLDAHVTDINKQVKDSLKDKEDASAIYRAVIAKMVHVCRFSRTWLPRQGKLEISVVEDTSAKNAMLTILEFTEKACQGQLKRGAAPRSDMERRISTLISSGNTGGHGQSSRR